MIFETMAELKQHLYFVHREDHPLILSSHGFPPKYVQNPDQWTVISTVTYRRVNDRMQNHINDGGDDLKILFKIERMDTWQEAVLIDRIKEEND